MSQTPDPVKQAGLHPTADQIEMYAYHLPDSPLSNLMVNLLPYQYNLENFPTEKFRLFRNTSNNFFLQISGYLRFLVYSR